MDRRQQILAAAHTLMATRGVAGLTVRSVASKAGVGASTLRHYFPSQRDLYDAVVRDAFNTQLDDLRITESTVPATERLTECIAQFLPRDDSGRASLADWFSLYIAGIGPERTDQGSRLLARLSGHARDRVQRWLLVLDDEGVLRAGSVQQLATALLALIDGLSLQLLIPDSELTVPEATDVLAVIISRALR